MLPRVPHRGFTDRLGASDTWTLLPGLELHAATLAVDDVVVVSVFYGILPPRVPSRFVLIEKTAELQVERRVTGLSLTVGLA